MRSHKAGRLLRGAEYGSALLSATAIALIMITLLSDAIARYIFGGSLPGVSNFAAEYLLVIAIYFSLAYTWSVGQHASVTLVSFERWPWAAPILRGINLVVTVFVLVLLVYANFQAMQSAQARGTVSAGSVAFEMWPAYLLICVGTAFFLGVVLVRLGGPRISADRAVPDIANSGNDSADERGAK